MNAEEFKKVWTDKKCPLTPLLLTRLTRFGLKKESVDFLSVAGLPNYAEPNLHFANDSDDLVYGINRLTEQFDFEEDKDDYERYISVGSCRDGDIIAIDTRDNDKILQLDHEDLFTPKYFNRSVEALASFLVLYRDFEKEVLNGNPADDYRQLYNFTNEQFSNLKERMILIDENAIVEDGFWKDEFEIILSLRKDFFNVYY